MPRDADERAIKEAFRSLALAWHPDRNKSPGAEEKFKEIASAYAVLSDPRKRREYDARGFAGLAGFSEEDLFRSVDFGDLFGGLNFDFGGMGFEDGGGLFDRFFGRRRAGPARGANVEVAVQVPLARILTGGEEKVGYTRTGRCAACAGTGARDGKKLRTCPACKGSGSRTQENRRRRGGGEVLIRSVTPCADCGGRGTIIEEPCPACAGRGVTVQEQSLTVVVPPGMEEGMALRVPGHGMPGDAPGSAPGDLFVIVRTVPDPRFERAGADLWRVETVPVPEAVLGGRRSVPTLEGSLEVTVPPGTQPGTVLRLGGKGLPHFGSDVRGHLYLRIDVEVPSRLTERQRQLYEQLLATEKAMVPQR